MHYQIVNIDVGRFCTKTIIEGTADTLTEAKEKAQKLAKANSFTEMTIEEIDDDNNRELIEAYVWDADYEEWV